MGNNVQLHAGMAATYDSARDKYFLYEAEAPGIYSDAPVAILTPAQMSALLGAYGFDIIDGQLVAKNEYIKVDGRKNIMAAAYGDQPVLPDNLAAAPPGDGSSLRDYTVWASELLGGALEFDALLALVRGNQRDIIAGRKLKNALHQQIITVKQDEIQAKKDQLEADRNAAWVQLGVSLTAMVVTAGLGLAGVAGTNEKRIVALAVSQSVGTVINKMGEAIDMETGFKRRSNDMQVEQQEYSLIQTLIEQLLQDTQSHEDEARNQFRDAIKAIEAKDQRDEQIVRSVTNI